MESPSVAFTRIDDAVDHEGVEVDGQIECGPEPLDHCDRSALSVRNARFAEAVALEAEECPYVDAGDGAAEMVIVLKRFASMMKRGVALRRLRETRAEGYSWFW